MHSVDVVLVSIFLALSHLHLVSAFTHGSTGGGGPGNLSSGAIAGVVVGESQLLFSCPRLPLFTLSRMLRALSVV